MSVTSEFSPLQEESTLLVVLEVFYLIFLIIFGLIGNIGLCAVVYTHRHLQIVSNYLIVNLSISDLLRIFFTLSVSTSVLIKRRWFYGETFCLLNGCYTLTFMIASLMSVALISANRFIQIVHHRDSATIFSKQRTKIMIFTLWFLACSISIPPNIGWGHYGFLSSRATCFIAVGSSYSYTTVLVLAFIATPFSVMVFCYVKIFLAVRRSRRRVVGRLSVGNLASAIPTESKENLRKEVKVAKTLLTLIGVYIVTWIPICVIHFVRLAKLAIISDSVDLVAAFLVSLSCVTNPWIYGFKNNHFRDQLKRMLCVKVRVMRETGRCQMNQFEMK
ncbi:melanopsin-like [Acropora palmata]|uniref:melanopsin-like n=1 Tax=Acropora palmata TaxID=6131 RepID=UPI003DA0C0D3